MEVNTLVLAKRKPDHVVVVVRYFDENGKRLQEPKDVVRTAVFEGSYHECEDEWKQLQELGTEACEKLYGEGSHYRVAVTTCDAPYHGLALSEAA